MRLAHRFQAPLIGISLAILIGCAQPQMVDQNLPYRGEPIVGETVSFHMISSNAYYLPDLSIEEKAVFLMMLDQVAHNEYSEQFRKSGYVVQFYAAKDCQEPSPALLAALNDWRNGQFKFRPAPCLAESENELPETVFFVDLVGDTDRSIFGNRQSMAGYICGDLCGSGYLYSWSISHGTIYVIRDGEWVS